MLRRVIQSNKFFKYLRNIHKIAQNRTCNSFPKLPSGIDYSKLLLGGQAVIFVKHNIENLDLLLQEAAHEGDVAIADLMFSLREQVIQICHEYETCLRMQMEIIEQATRAGPLSPKWDDLPEYRTKAIELNEELNSYIAILRTIGKLVVKGAANIFVEQREYMELISNKVQEVEELLRVEMAKIKKQEALLLELNRKSILK